MMNGMMNAVRNMDTNTVLSALGLERRRSPISFMWPFVAGLVVGTGVTLLMAPKSGRQMRRELGEKARSAGEQVGSAAETLVQDIQAQLSGENGPRKASSPVRGAIVAGSNAKG